MTWPNGKTEHVPATAGDQALTIQEGRGVIRAVPLKASGR